MQQARQDEGDSVQEVRRVQAGPGQTQVRREEVQHVVTAEEPKLACYSVRSYIFLLLPE